MVVGKTILNYSKLFMSGIFLLWLFIQSPFNPLYSGCRNAEMIFVKLHFIYWILVVSFLFWVMYFVKRDNFERKVCFLSVSTYALFMTYFIFFSLDVMDTGYSIAKQWAMFNGMWKENLDSIAGTNIIGGLWLAFPGRPFLIWARLGYIAVHTGIIYFSYKTLALYFRPKDIIVPFVFISLFLSIWHFYMTINYDNLPYLFFVIAIFHILKGSVQNKYHKREFIFAGIFMAFTIFCKITYTAAVVLPVFLILIEKESENSGVVKQKMIYFFFGIAITTGIIGLFLLLTGSNVIYLSQFTEVYTELVSVKDLKSNYSHDHSVSRLYMLYKSNLLIILFASFKYISLIVIGEYLIRKVQKIISLKILIIFLSGITLYSLTIVKNSSNQFMDISLTNITSLLAAIILVLVILYERENLEKYLTFIISGIGLFIFSIAGSDLVLRAAFHTGSSLVIFAGSLILIRKMKLSFLYYFVIVAFGVNIYTKKDNFYREADFKFISQPFSSAPLIGIKTNPQRADVVDSLIVYFETIADLDKKKVLFTHSNPLMYYLTNTKYFLKSPWDLTNDYDAIEEELHKTPPDIMVIPKLSHRIGNWPVGGVEDDAEKRAQKHYDLYKSIVTEYNYNEIYKNSFYTIYSLPGVAR